MRRADAATPPLLTPSEAVGEASLFSIAQRSDLDPAERVALVAEALPEPVSWAMMVIGFGGLEEVRFREPVVPGDRLVIAVERVRVRPKAMIVCRFQGIVRDRVVVDGIIKGVPLPVDALTSATAIPAE